MSELVSSAFSTDTADQPVGYSNGLDGKHYTLVFCRRNRENGEEVLLGMKKRGVGAGKFNGFGGKIEEGESVEEAAVRELMEECSVKAVEIKRVGYLVEIIKSSNMKFYIHIFNCFNFENEPVESSEMNPQWFNTKNIPYEKMWCDDIHWFPLLFANKSFTGRFNLIHEEFISDFQLIDLDTNTTTKKEFQFEESDEEDH